MKARSKEVSVKDDTVDDSKILCASCYILLMEEIPNNYLGRIKLWKYWVKLPFPQRVSRIFSHQQ